MVRAVPIILLAAVSGGQTPSRLPLPPEVVRVEGIPIERVQLSVSVLDPPGQPIVGLARSDFVVLEGGIPQTLIDFGPESDRLDRPLSAVFLVDRSGSLMGQMKKWGEACGSLLSVLRPIDEVRVATFTEEVALVQEFTRDAALLAASLSRIGQAGGGTRVFEAIDQTLREIRRRPGRKVIFLLTDGLDNVRQNWTTVGDPWLTDLVRRAIESQVTIVTILPGPSGRPFTAAQDLAVQTGGWWLYTSADLPALVRKLGERLMASYYLAYDSTRSAHQPGRRRIEVSVHRPGMDRLVVRAVEGVFAPRPVLQILERDLDEGDETERVLAASDLGLITDPKARALLRKALKDDSPQVRAAAAAALKALETMGARRTPAP